MAGPDFIELVILHLKPDATIEAPDSTAGKTWLECLAALREYPVPGQRFFFGREVEDESKGYLISYLWTPEDTAGFINSEAFPTWNAKLQTLTTGFEVSHLPLPPTKNGLAPLLAPVTEVCTASPVGPEYLPVMDKFMGLCEQDKPAGFVTSVVGECSAEMDGGKRTVLLLVGWESVEAHLGAKGTSSERNEVAKTLLAMGPKPVTVHVVFKEI